MLDLIITSYKLTTKTKVSVTYQEYIQYSVDHTYNTKLNIVRSPLLRWLAWTLVTHQTKRRLEHTHENVLKHCKL